MFDILTRLFQSNRRSISMRSRRHKRIRLSLEDLEGRIVPATWVVDTLLDNNVGRGGMGSLRWCMNQANNGDTINFQVSGTVSLTSALPSISKNITISAAGQNVTI